MNSVYNKYKKVPYYFIMKLNQISDLNTHNLHIHIKLFEEGSSASQFEIKSTFSLIKAFKIDIFFKSNFTDRING